MFRLSKRCTQIPPKSKAQFWIVVGSADTMSPFSDYATPRALNFSFQPLRQISAATAYALRGKIDRTGPTPLTEMTSTKGSNQSSDHFERNRHREHTSAR